MAETHDGASLASEKRTGHFIVKNAINTCYIDSLLMALFYSESINEYILNTDLTTGTLLYLQEFIRHDFVKQARKNMSVSEETMNSLRLHCMTNGWLNNNMDDFFRQQDVNEFYAFLIDALGGKMIEIQRETITEGGEPDASDTGKTEQIPFIPLSLSNEGGEEEDQVISIRKMLNDWMYNNVTEVKRFIMTDKGKEEAFVKSFNFYNIVNNPPIIALSINRFGNDGKRSLVDVIIQKKICPFLNKDTLIRREWEFHAAICHKGISKEVGHYYCLLSKGKQWYIFDDLKTPCLAEVRMDDRQVTNMIKKECVFLIYKNITPIL